VAGKRREKIV